MADLATLAGQITTHLSRPPYYCLLATRQHDPDPTALIQLMEAMVCSSGLSPQAKAPISMTEVSVRDIPHASLKHSTIYSRSTMGLPLHTDLSYIPIPDNCIAFAMETPDPSGGGESLLLSADDFIERLPPDLESTLRLPRFPFSVGHRLPILYGRAESFRVRYYRLQIEFILQKLGETMPDWMVQCLGQLDEIIQAAQERVRLVLSPGDVLFVNNWRVLHGRTPLSPNSPRRVTRYRASIPHLR